MPRKKVIKKSEKEEMRDTLKELFPDSVGLMVKVLKDDLKDRAGRRIKTTVGQRLAIAHEVVQQVLGRAPQGTALGTETVKAPITTLEVVKYVERALSEGGEEVAASVGEEEKDLRTREDWLEELEKEATGAE
jgi:hypothetical protein